jgi:hypothetical protein
VVSVSVTQLVAAAGFNVAVNGWHLLTAKANVSTYRETASISRAILRFLWHYLISTGSAESESHCLRYPPYRFIRLYVSNSPS